MAKRIFLYLCIVCAVLTACNDNDTFTTSRSAKLTFTNDTVRLDTVFSTIGSSTYSFWVYNQAGDGIRISSIRLRQGNQTGFRVNVDGTYLDNSLGSIATDLEVRKDDSIRVFVELTAPKNMQETAQQVDDDLVFLLESGVSQQVHLTGFAWDALLLKDLNIRKDTLIATKKPVIVYGGITVDSAATLTIRNTTLYFHDQAGLDVYGRLRCDSVLMRGDRLDHLFDYLPYDRVSGQWRGVRFHPSSYKNELKATEIRNAEQGVLCDSANYIENRQRLYMERCVVHNCKGPGLKAVNANVGLLKCQFTNTLNDCVCIYGGLAIIDACTIAQFYPFDANRGNALFFTNRYNKTDIPIIALQCSNSIITGYADDELMGKAVTENVGFVYSFVNCLLRTPEVKDDTVSFSKIIWEDPKADIQGKKHFRLIDETNLKYDFHLDSLSTAKGMGCY
jgi:hypothetical protein